MANSKIAWTNKTWNPLIGCSMGSPGCAHCYAETMGNRLRGMALKDREEGKPDSKKTHDIDAIGENGKWTGKLTPVGRALFDPFSWKKPQMIFVNSRSDLFH